MNPATVGLDLAKNVFHVHVADASGRTLESKRLTRRELMPYFESLPSCLIGIEACATAHNWARQLQGLGHDVRLIPPGYVKPFVRRGAKNDATDAAAICEAVTRPNMRFVPIKSREDQAFLMLHRARGLRTPTHPVGHSDNIRSGVPDIRSPRDVATERAFLMSPLFDAVKLFEVRDRGAARGAVRAPRRWRGVARGGGPVARHVSFFRSEGPSKGNL